MATKKPTARSAVRKPSAKRTITLKPPRLGEVWKAQGGIYLGIIRGDDGQPDAHLIANVGTAPDQHHVWGPTKKAAGALSHRDGLANTRAMARADSALAKAALKATFDGHTDFYLPAKDEARIAYINAREHFQKDGWYWTSTQDEFDDDYAWFQNFGYGNQYGGLKSNEYRAFLVRRLPFSHPIIQ